MARGWESKSVEDQIESSRAKPLTRKPGLTVEQAERLRERESLQLSRKRVTKDIETAANPKYREVLKAALAHLDQRLTALD